MENRQRYWGRAAIVLGFGGIPVLPLAVLAALCIHYGFDRSAYQPEALGFVGWGLAGIYGSLSLWVAAFRRISPAVVVGLLTGIVALLPLSYAILTSRYAPDSPLVTLVLLGPVVTAIAILIESLVRRRVL